MSDLKPDAGRDAAATLDRAFELRDRWPQPVGRTRIGIFGNGMPEHLVAAAGAVPIHVSMGFAAAGHDIVSVVEPFVDEEVRTFLVRHMRGDFAEYRAIIFARDDAPALIAYQYASEWIRQDRPRAPTPPLFLWNLVHTDTIPVRRFNAIQAEKLFDFLGSSGLSRPDAEALRRAAAIEDRRRVALDAMTAAIGDTLSGTTALRWRNAGRFMPADEHAALLEGALTTTGQGAPNGVRIGVVGSPLACPLTYAMLERFGPLVCDLQPLGSVWPGPGNTATHLETVLDATARDPFCPRTTPASAHRAAMVARLLDARCELVVCQLAQTDDTFGWEIPRLFAELKARGVTCVNLGFRDARPSQDWRDQAAARIKTALEAIP